MLVEAFVPQPAIEALDEAVLGRLTGCDVVPIDTVVLLPCKDRPRGQLGAVVADDHAGPAAALDEPIELASDPDAGERVVNDERQAFPANRLHMPEALNFLEANSEKPGSQHVQI